MTTERRTQLRDAIVEVGRRLYARGYTASNDGNISVRLDGGRLLMTPKSVCKGFMTPDMMCRHRSRREEARRRARSLVGDADAPRGLPAAARRQRGRARASADRDRVRRRRDSARSRRARRGRDDARQRADRGVRDAVDEGAAGGRPEVRQGARRHAAGQPRRADARAPICSRAYYKMETIEHFAKISLVARLLGGERLLSRQEVDRLQGLRGMYGIASPAPICPPARAASRARGVRRWATRRAARPFSRRKPTARGSCPTSAAQ